LLRKRVGYQRLCLGVLALLAAVQLLAVTALESTLAAAPATGTEGDQPPWPQVVDPIPHADLVGGVAAPAADPLLVTPAVPQLVTQPDVVPTAAAVPAPLPQETTSFADRFPAHAAAVQDLSRPATTRWALLIGINEHRGTVADNIGSRQDAEDLRAHLLASGWRDDHILLLTDRDATRDNIVDGIAWLAERTDEHSIGIFHYSGHSKEWFRRDVDGDGEAVDEGLWPSDDRYIPDGELVSLLDPVRPHALWISFATCNAAGMADPGLVQPGRILTFSSGEPQKSYENPAWGNSVWGWFMIEQAFGAGLADTDGDGRTTVGEAFEWSRPRARDTTTGQRYGTQDAVMVDQVPGGFDLLIPGKPAPPRQAPAEPSASAPAQPPAQPQPLPSGGQQQAPPPREPYQENYGNRICLLCG
jgi:Caspase domain